MDPHTGVLPGLKVMVDRAGRGKFALQRWPLAACPQEVKDGVENGTKVGGARSPARSRRRQNWRNPGPRRVGQVGVVESRVHRTVPLARVSALSRQTSTFQTPSDFKTIADFRKDNRDAFKPVFRQFVLLCRKLELFGGELLAVDGTRLKAVNSTERNFITLS